VQRETKLLAVVDVDVLEDAASECEICAMPTFIMLENGSKVEQLLGAGQEALSEMIGSNR